jgi:hypothetical protein
MIPTDPRTEDEKAEATRVMELLREYYYGLGSCSGDIKLLHFIQDVLERWSKRHTYVAIYVAGSNVAHSLGCCGALRVQRVHPGMVFARLPVIIDGVTTVYWLFTNRDDKIRVDYTLETMYEMDLMNDH